MDIEEHTPAYAPEAPNYLLPEVREAWDEYWESPLATSSLAVDKFVLFRLFSYRNQWFGFHQALQDLGPQEMIIDGSREKSAIQLHPYAKHMLKLEEKINMLEKELGLNPLARARLGIDMGNAKLTWDEMKKKTQAAKKSEQAKRPERTRKRDLPVIDVEEVKK